MNKIRMFQLDAFTDRLFSGNPAAVCILKTWLSKELMQAIAAENNLAETAFVVADDGSFQIRWFTPTVEVDLCGHATLASAYALFNCLGHTEPEIKFFSPRSGELRVFRQEEDLFLDFPTDTLNARNDHEQLTRCLNTRPNEVYKGKTDFIAIVDNEDVVAHLKPDFQEIAKLPARGLIVTARGKQVDFVSRFFAPQSGIDEDPATGSAHTSLIPLWADRLSKKEMTAKQLSPRGGSFLCVHKGERCFIGGRARLYLTGDISIH